jgi:lipocalin
VSLIHVTRYRGKWQSLARASSSATPGRSDGRNLFRQYDVRVAEVGRDEHGPFVRVTPPSAGEGADRG